MEIEKQIAKVIAQANGIKFINLGLRFDKVVVGLMKEVRTTIEPEIPEATTIILTITAPIKHPAKTAKELVKEIRNLLNHEFEKDDRVFYIFQNHINVKIIYATKQPVKIIGLIHNPDVNIEMLLELIAKWVMKV